MKDSYTETPKPYNSTPDPKFRAYKMKYPFRTGIIWRKPARVRGQIVRRACENLKREYGRPRLGNPRDPLDDLVYIIISNKTSPEIAGSTYQNIKKRFQSWEEVLTAHYSQLREIIKPAGLSAVKSKQIRAALKKIARDFRTCNLDSLRGKPEREMESYLSSLPGVSRKVAKCVMIYTMGADVLPVDAHVHRITTRLGWTARKRADQCHAELETLIFPKYHYAFHVDCVLHGRSICRPKSPFCNRCCINQHCEYFKRLR